MRILHCFETLAGGPSTYINELLPYQIAAYGRQNISVLCPEKHKDHLNARGVNVHYFKHKGRTIPSLISVRSAWKKTIGEGNFDVIHVHSTYSGILARTIMKIPATIYCAHGWSFNMETSAIRKYIYKIVERLLAYRTDAIVNISHSEHSTAIAAGIAPTKCVMIYNGIRRTPLAVDPPKTDKIKLLFVGRLDKQKGYDLLCEAIREIGSIEYHLTVIGERVVDAKPKFHVGSSSVVTELGWQSPEVIAAHMQASDIVIMPSRWEGFGYVAIEAMREGRGVMGTAVGGLREIIVNDETGFLIPPNDLNALKKAILQLREVDLRKIGRAARKRFEEKFTADETFMNLDTLYRKVLQRSSHENTAY